MPRVGVQWTLQSRESDTPLCNRVRTTCHRSGHQFGRLV